MIVEYKGKRPSIHPNSFVASNATIIGDVIIEEGASIWYGAVLRGDMSYIRIGKNSNIQDNATIHTDTDVPTIVGEGVTVGHNAILHGCTLENFVLVGIGAIVLNNSLVKSGSMIGAGSLVRERQVCEGSSLYVGVPAKIKKLLVDSEIKFKKHAMTYVALSKDYMDKG